MDKWGVEVSEAGADKSAQALSSHNH
jgi:hypothetical protein